MYKTKTEDDLRQVIRDDYFPKNRFDTYLNHSKIDISVEYNDKHILWMEAKNKITDIETMFAQLVFTIYKIYNDEFTPPYIGVCDIEKMAFIRFDEIEFLYDEYKMADFDWTVTPSNHNTKEFKLIASKIRESIRKKDILWERENLYELNEIIFYYDKDKNKLKDWINNVLISSAPVGPQEITEKNVNKVYTAWLDKVKSSIEEDWDAIRTAYNILDCDYFLADLFASDNQTLYDKLFVLLTSDHYQMTKESVRQQKDMWNKRTVHFKDKQYAHKHFWEGYIRPPAEQYWDLILNRRDLLVPPDIRKRLGAFFTPPECVKLSQQYMRDAFGDLDNYYIWDCAAGTGNLLEGLDNDKSKYNIFASDINIENVYVMRGRVTDKKLNLLRHHIFQFDFLNDDFALLPDELLNIINDENKRKKLIVYINPPYAESHNKQIPSEAKIDVHRTKIQEKYSKVIGTAGNELFAQFLARIYFEIPDCKIGEFSKLKVLLAPNFKSFRKLFLARLERCFVIPAYIFDNVVGKFPIGFKIWDTSIKEHFDSVISDVYNEKYKKIKSKAYADGVDCRYINNWYKTFVSKDITGMIGRLSYAGNDIQHQNYTFIVNNNTQGLTQSNSNICQENLIQSCIYYSVRKCIKATWINDRDQFLYPNDGWQKDLEFQSDCLVYALFNTNIQSKYGVNHWIPYYEYEVDAKEKFASNFMADFINEKIEIDQKDEWNQVIKKNKIKLEFSKEALKVLEIGKELWKHYHNKLELYNEEYDINASLYDIKEHFCGRDKDRLRNKSKDDNVYNDLIDKLKEALDILTSKIEQKVYDYGFLLK